MNTIEQIRRNNLALLRASFSGKDYEFAEVLDIAPSYYGQLKNGGREIGSNVARNIEKATKKPHGWLDNSHSNAQSAMETHAEYSTNIIELPIYDEDFSKDHNLPNIKQKLQIKLFATNAEWIDNNLTHIADINKLCIITGQGESMQPTIEDGAAVFLDLGATHWSGDQIYALKTDDNALMIKRLQKLSTGNFSLISDNSNYPTEERSEVQIIGRVVGTMNFNKL